MNIELRLEEEKDYRQVEELTREAFWNLYQPGCDEHLVVRNMRHAKEFVGELAYVAMDGSRIIGNIMYALSKIRRCNSDDTVLTFGPVSVLPEYQHRGIGNGLIRHTIDLAGKMGYRAILIYGNPDYYSKFGFKPSKDYGITNQEGKYPAALLALELYPGALAGVTGIFDEGPCYQTDHLLLEEYEKGFAPKEKLVTATQQQFMELACRYL